MREGIKGLRRARNASFIAISTMTVTLTLLGFFAVITFNIRRIPQFFREQVGFEIFIDNSLDTRGIRALEDRIAALEGIEEIRFISKAEALERFSREFGEDPSEILGENPLPASFQVIPENTYSIPSKLEPLIRGIESLEGVDEVVYRGQLVRLIDRTSRAVLVIDAILLVVVFMAAILLVSNTLRLTILAQSEKIEIMQLVGATRRFIKRPYVIQGLMQGGIAGLLGTLLLRIVGWIVSMRFPRLLQMPAWLWTVPLAVGLVLGITGSRVGIRRFLRA